MSLKEVVMVDGWTTWRWLGLGVVIGVSIELHEIAKAMVRMAAAMEKIGGCL